MAWRQILTPAQRGRRKAYGVQSWLNRKNFRQRKDLLYDSLDKFAERLALHSNDGQADPLQLADLLRVVIAGDRGIAEWFYQRNKGSTELKTEEGFKDLTTIIAGSVVEKYTSERDLPSPAKVEGIKYEQLVHEIDNLVDLAVKTARLSEQAGQELQEALYEAPFIQDLTGWVAEQLIELITADSSSLVFYEADEDSEEPIPRFERDTEIAKSALMRLRVSELREIAGENAPGGSANLDALTSHIVREHGSDFETIAELILRYEKPPPDHGLSTRIVALAEEPDLKKARDRIERFRGQYMRIGVARWFIFEDSKMIDHDNELFLRGRVRFYSPSPRSEYGEYALDPGLGIGHVEMRLRAGHPWIEFTVNRGGDVGALSRAVEQVAGIKSHSALPIKAAVTEGLLMRVDQRTLQILDFLSTGFRGQGLQVRNMTMARFEAGTAPASGDQSRPLVRSVRLAGNQLSSHPQACSMIMQGRALLALELTLEAGLTGGSALLPVRIELTRDHAAIFTALTPSLNTSDVTRVHRDLTRRLEVSLEAGIRDLDALNQEGKKIEARRQVREEDLSAADILIQGPPPPTPPPATASVAVAQDAS